MAGGRLSLVPAPSHNPTAESPASSLIFRPHTKPRPTPHHRNQRPLRSDPYPPNRSVPLAAGGPHSFTNEPTQPWHSRHPAAASGRCETCNPGFPCGLPAGQRRGSCRMPTAPVRALVAHLNSYSEYEGGALDIV